MLKLFWYCLGMSEEDQHFVSDKLVELSKLLKTPPSGITLEVKPLPPSLVEVVESIYKSGCNHDWPFCKFCKQIRIKLNSVDSKNMPLLVYCKGDSKLAEAAKGENPLAQWGLASDYLVSAVYEPNNEYLLWHEALHLFEACDCYCYYNPNAGTNCDLTNCIMWYKPLKETVGEWPFLCEKNIKRIQACSEKRTHN